MVATSSVYLFPISTLLVHIDAHCIYIRRYHNPLLQDNVSLVKR